jgi:hypothetical protein
MTQVPSSLDTLARRGHERGATAVLAAARHDARHHQRQQTVVAGATAVTLLAGTVGAGVLLLRDDSSAPVTIPSATTGPSGATAASAAPGSVGVGGEPIVTGVRVVGHDGYDRIEIDFDGPVPPDPEGEGTSMPTTPECAIPEDVYDGTDGVQTWGLPSGASDTPDGLAEGISGQRVTGDTSYVTQVAPLCSVDGYVWFAIGWDEPKPLDIGDGSGPGLVPPAVDMQGTIGMGKCVVDDPPQVQFDVFEWLDTAGTQPSSDEVCSPTEA